jgi:putative transposase
MQRRKALQPGLFYHIYNRGNNGENIFHEERNCRYFLELYAKHIHPVVDTYAYCLMPNHFHVLGRTKSEAELAQMSDFFEKSDISNAATRGFAAFFTAYTKAINKAYSRTGRLFQEHFGRIEVTSDDYFTNLVFYIHFNPQKHGFASDFSKWPWSSYEALRGHGTTRLQRAGVLEWFGSATQLETFHQGAVAERAIAPLIVDDLL